MARVPLFLVMMVVSACTSAAYRAELRRWQELRESPAPKVDLNARHPLAEDDLDGPMTLDQARALALRHNDRLGAEYHSWRAAIERVPQSDSWPEPELMVAQFLRDDAVRLGTARRWGLSQAFPWWGKLSARHDEAFAESREAGARYEMQRRDLLVEVTGSFAEYAYVAQARVFVTEQLAWMRRVVGAAQARYAAGQGSQAEFMRAQIEVDRLDERLRTLDRMAGPLAAEILRCCASGGTTSTEFAPLPELPGLSVRHTGEAPHLPPSSGGDADPPTDPRSGGDDVAPQLSDADFADSPELAEHRAHLEAARERLRLAGLSPVPDLMFGFEDGGMEPGKVSLGARIPLNWGRYGAERRQRGAEVDAAKRLYSDTLAKLHVRALMAWARFDDAARRDRLHRESLIPKAELAAEATEAAFRTGGADFSAVADAFRGLLDLQLDAARARADAWIHWADWERLVGPEDALDTLERSTR